MQSETKIFQKDNTWHTKNVLNSLISPIVWQCDLFGNGSLIINLSQEVSWWQRFWNKFFFKSKWSRVN